MVFPTSKEQWRQLDEPEFWIYLKGKESNLVMTWIQDVKRRNKEHGNAFSAGSDCIKTPFTKWEGVICHEFGDQMRW